MGIPSSDIVGSVAWGAQRQLRRLVPLVAMMRKVLIAHNLAVDCSVCDGKGFPGEASATDCKVCAGSGIAFKEADAKARGKG